MKTKKTILVVGCGSIGQRHARLLAESPDTTLWACDLNKDFLAQTADCAELSGSCCQFLWDGLRYLCWPTKQPIGQSPGLMTCLAG